jgi:hypothetical protein
LKNPHLNSHQFQQKEKLTRKKITLVIRNPSFQMYFLITIQIPDLLPHLTPNPIISEESHRQPPNPTILDEFNHPMFQI